MDDLVKMFEHGDAYNANAIDHVDHDLSSLDIAAAVGFAESLIEENFIGNDCDIYEDYLNDLNFDEPPEMISLKNSKTKIPAFEQYVMSKCTKNRG